MSLNRRAAQQQIRLVVIIPKTPQILNTAQRRLTIRHRSIKIVLFAILIDAEALERQIAPRPVMRLDGPGQKQRGLHAEVGHAVLHHRQLDGDDTGHFDGAAKGDFAVALGEVQVADAELGPLDVHRQVDLAAAAKVLDVAVAAVLGASRDGARAFAADFGFDVAGAAAGVHVLRLGGLGDDFVEVLGFVGIDQLAFAAVPSGQDFGRGRAAEDSGVD